MMMMMLPNLVESYMIYSRFTVKTAILSRLSCATLFRDQVLYDASARGPPLESTALTYSVSALS